MSRRSPPTTRTRPGSSPSTGCGPASSRPPGCSPRRPAGSSPTRWCATYDGDMSGVDRTPEHRHRRRAGARRRAGRAPGRRRTSWPPGPAGSSPRCSRRPGRVYADVRDVLAAPAAAGCRCCRWSARTPQRKARLRGDGLRRPAAPGRPGSPGTTPRSARSSGTGSGSCCSTSTRTPATPRWCCCDVAVRRRPPGDRGRRPVPVDLRLARGQRRHAGPVPDRVRRAPAGAPAAALSLTTSWRNRPEILARGQRAVRPAAGGRRPGAPSCAPAGAARSGRPRAAAGTVHCALLPTYADEAAWIADSVLAAWRGAARMPDARPSRSRWSSGRPAPCWSGSAARSRRSRRRCGPAGLPVEVVGLGGLLDTPEVRDVVCTLRVLADPTDGASLLRLLTGARWRIGPRDLVALHRRARAHRRGPAPRRPTGATSRRTIAADRLDEATLVEALADLGAAAAVLGRGLRAAAGVRPGAGAAAAAAGPAAARPGRRHRAHHRPGRRGGGARPGAPATPGWPGATWTRSATWRPGSRRDRRRHAGRVPRLPGRGRGRGARPDPGRGRGGRGRGADPHRARRQGPGVGRRRGRRAEPGRLARAGPQARDHCLTGIGRAAVPAARRRRRAARLDLADGGGPEGRGRGAVDAFADAWRAPRRAGGAAAGVRGGDPAAAAAAVLRVLVGRGRERPRGPSVFLEEIARRCADRRRASSTQWAGAAARRDATRTRCCRTGRRAPTGRPTRSAARRPDGRPTAAAGPPLIAARPRTSSRRRAGRAGRTRTIGGGAVAARGRPAARRAGPSWPGRRRPSRCALPAHLSVSQLVALRRDPQRLARSLRRPLPSRPTRTPAAAPRSTPGWSSGSAPTGCSTSTSCPARPTRTRRRTTTLAELQERVPGQRVGRPGAGRGRGAVRDGGRRRGGAGPDGRGLRRRPDGRLDVDRLEDRPQPDRRRRPRRPRCSSPRTGWPGPSWPACRSTGSAPRFHYVRDGVTVRPADLLDEAGLTG